MKRIAVECRKGGSTHGEYAGYAMSRRDFVARIGGMAIMWPLAACTQKPAMPVIGALYLTSNFLNLPDAAGILGGFRAGLSEAGYVEGKTVAVEYRWADFHDDRLPALAADLVSRHVAVLVAGGGAARAAKAATSGIPIVFVEQDDPVAIGLVASLGRPGGNVTGVTTFAVNLDAKRLEELHELVPEATVIAQLVNPDRPTAEPQVREAQKAARSFGVQLEVLGARSEPEIETAFARLMQLRAGGLLVSSDLFLDAHHDKIIGLAAQHAVPAIYELRHFVDDGGLMSYGPSLAESFREMGIYTGKILRGAKPADLPVLQPTKFDLAINLKTAKAIGLTIPDALLRRADEVIR
ncbi:MAG TPA: ABC transporter substrate-binding protein [Casimicrobiaceae bacterium]|nr:ABC transporter substrate-binding protein [Casimicrobiaceae bacterium]